MHLLQQESSPYIHLHSEQIQSLAAGTTASSRVAVLQLLRESLWVILFLRQALEVSSGHQLAVAINSMCILHEL